MPRRDFEDDEPYVVIEQRSTSVTPFLIGLALGAGAALLFAPRSGEETRREIKRRALRARRLAEKKASEITESVTETYEDARRRVEDAIDTAKDAIDLRKRQVTRAVDAGRAAARDAIDAGRAAAQDAREDLESRIATTKAAYTAGANAAKRARASSDEVES
jgi:gas vesicle protein